MNSENIRQLIEKARDGDTDALGTLMKQFRPYLVSRARHQLDSQVRARVDPSDVVQQTCLEIHRDFQSFKGVCEKELLGWLTQILHNNVSNTIRCHVLAQKRSIRKELSLNDPAGPCGELGAMFSEPISSPSAKAMRREGNAELTKAVEQLPRDQRDVVRLRHLEGWSLRQLAEHFGRSEVAVAGLLKRSMQNLRARLSTKKHG